MLLDGDEPVDLNGYGGCTAATRRIAGLADERGSDLCERTAGTSCWSFRPDPLAQCRVADQSTYLRHNAVFRTTKRSCRTATTCATTNARNRRRLRLNHRRLFCSGTSPKITPAVASHPGLVSARRYSRHRGRVRWSATAATASASCGDIANRPSRQLVVDPRHAALNLVYASRILRRMTTRRRLSTLKTSRRA